MSTGDRARGYTEGRLCCGRVCRACHRKTGRRSYRGSRRCADPRVKRLASLSLLGASLPRDSGLASGQVTRVHVKYQSQCSGSSKVLVCSWSVLPLSLVGRRVAIGSCVMALPSREQFFRGISLRRNKSAMSSKWARAEQSGDSDLPTIPDPN